MKKIKSRFQHCFKSFWLSAPTAYEVAVLSDFQRPEVLAGILRGDFRVPLDKALPLAKALGCDEKLLFKLVMSSWFDTTGGQGGDRSPGECRQKGGAYQEIVHMQ